MGNIDTLRSECQRPMSDRGKRSGYEFELRWGAIITFISLQTQQMFNARSTVLQRSVLKLG